MNFRNICLSASLCFAGTCMAMERVRQNSGAVESIRQQLKQNAASIATLHEDIQANLIRLEIQATDCHLPHHTELLNAKRDALQEELEQLEGESWQLVVALINLENKNSL